METPRKCFHDSLKHISFFSISAAGTEMDFIYLYIEVITLEKNLWTQRRRADGNLYLSGCGE
jgi:hypothetical protein